MDRKLGGLQSRTAAAVQLRPGVSAPLRTPCADLVREADGPSSGRRPAPRAETPGHTCLLRLRLGSMTRCAAVCALRLHFEM